MRKLNIKFSKRQIKLGCSGIISLLIALLLCAMCRGMLQGQEHQQMAKRWSKDGGVSQISCFFSPSAGMTSDSILQFEHNLDKALLEESISVESTNPSARLWADAYSASGKVTIESDKGSISVNAIGVGGDFFLFHPQKLLYGSYFSGHDLMSDHIIIDEDAAWQLFGSNNVDGKIVYIGNIPHIISGVIKREDSRMADNAGLNSSVAYVSYDTLQKYGNNFGINSYEIVMPNPVKGYAKKYVSENIGVTENDIEVVENTTRFQFLNLWKILMRFGSRSMNSKAIIYPYWENMARGYEDYAALYLVFILLFFIYPVILLLIALIYYWKHKKWTLSSIYRFLIDKKDDLYYKVYRKIKNRKENQALKLKKAELEILDLEEEKNEKDDEKSN